MAIIVLRTSVNDKRDAFLRRFRQLREGGAEELCRSQSRDFPGNLDGPGFVAKRTAQVGTVMIDPGCGSRTGCLIPRHRAGLARQSRIP